MFNLIAFILLLIPANAAVLKCPECRAKKEVVQIMSGNTFGATVWSDTKMDAPMLPRASYIQKCENCGAYYFMTDKVRIKDAKAPSNNKGELPLEHLKEALYQLQPSGQDEYILRLYILWAFNDRYGGVNLCNIPDYEWEYHVDNVQRLLTMDLDTLFRAELHREICEYDRCIQLLEANENTDAYLDLILNAARNQNRQVIRLTGNRKREPICLANGEDCCYPMIFDGEDGYLCIQQ